MPLNLTLADVEKIGNRLNDLDPQWKETVIDLIQDWLEMNRKPIAAKVEKDRIGKAFAMGGKVVAQLEALEEILKSPLCEPCRRLIERDPFSV